MSLQISMAIAVAALINAGGFLVAWLHIPRETGIPLLVNVLVGVAVALVIRRIDRYAKSRPLIVVPRWPHPRWMRLLLGFGALVACAAPVFAGPSLADVAGWPHSIGRDFGILACLGIGGLMYVYVMPILLAHGEREQANKHAQISVHRQSARSRRSRGGMTG